MEPPFLVFRDKTARGVDVITSVPISDLFAKQRAARQLMWAALQGEENARKSVEAVFALALSSDVEQRGNAVVAAWLLKDALAEIQESRAAQQAQAPPRQTVEAQEVAHEAPVPPGQGVSVGGASGGPAADYAARAQASYDRAMAEKRAREAAAKVEKKEAEKSKGAEQ